jgi:hypothetical protein
MTKGAFLFAFKIDLHLIRLARMNFSRLISPTGSASMTCLMALLLIHSTIETIAQRHFTEQLTFTETVPKDLLAARSVVLHDYTFKQSELEEMQKAFQQIGIDAVAYFESDVVMAGSDVTKAFSQYFATRQIKYLLFFEKIPQGYQLIGVSFDGSQALFDPKLAAWRVQKEKLSDLLRTVFQDSWRGQKKQNFLVNEFPETDINVDPTPGSRQQFYAIDLKVDNLAVPKFGDAAMDAELEKFFAENYGLKYKLIEKGTDEKNLRKEGFLYVLCFIHTRGRAAKALLGYNQSGIESLYASITFPNGQMQLKTLPANAEVYKFYVRHLVSGNIFLGTKWDADVTWQEALRNQIFGFKIETKN